VDKAPFGFAAFPQMREERPNLGEEEKHEVLQWCVYAGRHFRQDGWLMWFWFPNGLTATIVAGPCTRGIEVGVMDGDWLIDVFEDLCGEDVIGVLREVMKRSLA
jgi:hypothetical protein